MLAKSAVNQTQHFRVNNLHFESDREHSFALFPENVFASKSTSIFGGTVIWETGPEEIDQDKLLDVQNYQVEVQHKIELFSKMLAHNLEDSEIILDFLDQQSGLLESQRHSLIAQLNVWGKNTREEFARMNEETQKEVLRLKNLSLLKNYEITESKIKQFLQKLIGKKKFLEKNKLVNGKLRKNIEFIFEKKAKLEKFPQILEKLKALAREHQLNLRHNYSLFALVFLGLLVVFSLRRVYKEVGITNRIHSLQDIR